MGPVVISGLTWLIGHLASKATDKSTDGILNIWRKRDLLNELDDYNNEIFKGIPELAIVAGWDAYSFLDYCIKGS